MVTYCLSQIGTFKTKRGTDMLFYELEQKRFFKMGLFFCKSWLWFRGRNTSRLILECPGELRDFDADEEFGGDGVALCPKCLGTGIVILNSSRFLSLSLEVSEIRRRSLDIQCSKPQGWQDELQSFNDRLKAIAREGLVLVKWAVGGCLALQLSKDVIDYEGFRFPGKILIKVIVYE